MDIAFSSTTELAAAIRNRKISAVEALDTHLAQIDSHNAAINAVISGPSTFTLGATAAATAE